MGATGSIKDSPKRARALNRQSNGAFGEWKGGLKGWTFKGTMIHIGKEFKRQHGRTARRGEAVRKKNQDGTFNKNAVWYIRSKFGWRQAGTGARKPTGAEINARLKSVRPGRGK